MSDDNSKFDKALKLLNQRGLDGLIIYSNGTCNILSPSYFHYISGARPLGPNNAVIISKAGDVALLVEPRWDANRFSGKSLTHDIRGSCNFVKDMGKILLEFKISGSVGIAGLSQMTEDITLSAKILRFGGASVQNPWPEGS